MRHLHKFHLTGYLAPADGRVPPLKGDTVREIKLTQGYVAVVDDDDYEWLSKSPWHVLAVKDKRWNGRQYAFARTAITMKMDDGSVWRKNETMHRIITGAKHGEIVDHINHDPLDNRRENLRICTPTESAQNCRKRQDHRGQKCSSKWKGVTKSTGIARPWLAKITSKKKKYYLGSFENEMDAALAYDAAAKEYHGDFAALNFPNDRHIFPFLARRNVLNSCCWPIQVVCAEREQLFTNKEKE